MSFDPTNLKQYQREYTDFLLSKFKLWKEKNLSDAVSMAAAEGAARLKYKDHLE